MYTLYLSLSISLSLSIYIYIYNIHMQSCYIIICCHAILHTTIWLCVRCLFQHWVNKPRELVHRLRMLSQLFISTTKRAYEHIADVYVNADINSQASLHNCCGCLFQRWSCKPRELAKTLRSVSSTLTSTPSTRACNAIADVYVKVEIKHQESLHSW